MAAGIDTEKTRLLEAEFIEFIKGKGEYAIYSSSENSIGWISENLGFTGLPENEFSKTNQVEAAGKDISRLLFPGN